MKVVLREDMMIDLGWDMMIELGWGYVGGDFFGRDYSIGVIRKFGFDFLFLVLFLFCS